MTKVKVNLFIPQVLVDQVKKESEKTFERETSIMNRVLCKALQERYAEKEEGAW